jgi:hypothetical protein
MNDPFFGSFDDALIHTSGPRLPADALVPGSGVRTHCSKSPSRPPARNFLMSLAWPARRVGQQHGDVRPAGRSAPTFQFEGDPETFDLDPVRRDALTLLMRPASRISCQTIATCWPLCAWVNLRRTLRADAAVCADARGDRSAHVDGLCSMDTVGPWIRRSAAP